MQGVSKTALALILGILLAVNAMPAKAQDRPDDTMQQVKLKIKADKKQFISENMQLTETEAKAFWPVYENIQKDLDKHNKKFEALIKDYAKSYDTLTDQKAFELTNNYMALETQRVYLLKLYMPRLAKALGSKKTLRYLQLENKVYALVRFDMTEHIPLAK